MEATAVATSTIPTAVSIFRLGLFGDTRSGKTVYLAALQWAAKHRALPERVVDIRAADDATAEYIEHQVATIESGEWPPGTLNENSLCLLVDLANGGTLAIETRDFKGGSFGDAPAGFLATYGRCSAYVFLVDPGIIPGYGVADPKIEDREMAARQLGKVIPALELLRRRSWGWPGFHPPVAVVFTKGDRYPEAMRYPREFAEKHAPQISQYLRTHAPHRHKFFAVSSTGPLPEGDGRPPAQLMPEGIVEPILWCHEAKKRVTRFFWRAMVAVFVMVVVGSWVVLRLDNAKDISAVRKGLPTNTDVEVHEQYKRIRNWQGLSLFALTHPWERQRLLVEVLDEAMKRAEEQARSAPRLAGKLTSAEHYRDAERVVREFKDRYQGTGHADRLDQWLRTQKNNVTATLIKQLHEAAKAGNESRFNELAREYQQIASLSDRPFLDVKTTLEVVLIEEKAKRVWLAHKERPGDVTEIRMRCTDAEKELERRPLGDRHTPKYREFIRLVRQTYDYLHESPTRTVYFSLESARSRDVKWYVAVAGNTVAGADWAAPVRMDAKTDWHVTPGSFTLDLRSPDTYMEFGFYDDNWFWPLGSGNGFAKLGMSVLGFAAAVTPGNPRLLTTNAGDSYKLVLGYDGDKESIHLYAEWIQKLRKLADELFQQSR